MFRSSAAVRVLLASAFVLACGGVDDPAGEPPSPQPLAGGAGAGQEAAGGSSPTTTTSASGQGGTDPSSNPTPGLESGGAGGATALPQAVFCDAPAKVFVPSCGSGACHDNSGATIGDFGADAQRAYNFVDKDAVRHADCGRIIDSRDYSQSLILRKLTQGAFEVPHCGGIMPIPSYPPLSRDQIDCVASWLQQFQVAR